MLGTIGFEKYRIRCIIGIEPHERIVEQDILVDLEVEYDLLKAATTDALVDTVDYVQLSKICHDMAVSGRYYLLEKYVMEVVSEIRCKFLVKSISMCARKPMALKNAENCFVRVKI